MGLRRSYAAALVAVALAVAVGLAPQRGEATTGPPHASGQGAAAPRSITLITGDRLTVFGPDQVGIERGKGRAGVSFVTRKEHGQARIIPVDALPFLRSGRLDDRLFNLTALLEYGYDDSRPDLPLIVTAPTSGRDKAARPAPPAGARVVRDLPAVRAVAARVDRKDIGTLWKSIKARGHGDDAPTIWLDGVRRLDLDVSVPQVGAPDAWRAGYTGTGVTVAVVDSGVDATHPDLAGQVVAQRNFVDTEDGRDYSGHGTHVASTIAGAGAEGRNSGVAPGARLVAAKVCGVFGCPESSILAGMHWAVAEQQAKIVNMSLGHADTPGVDPLEQAVQELTAQYGALFVTSAGNVGADASVSSPGSADVALSVGAVDDREALASFSSRGPRIGDAALKPDITAPGVDIVAARSKDSARGRPGDRYVGESGTSMAAPHVAGAAAILAQRRPGWGPQELKAALMASARPNPAIGIFGQGAGRVDVPHALGQSITTSPPSVSFGRQTWPHDDDTPVTKTVTYRNAGAAAVTLDLAVELSGPDRSATPAGMFRLGASQLAVPAGGTAEVAVTADTRVAGPDGFAGGHLVATAGESVTRTALAVDKEVESYDLTLRHTDRTGRPTQRFLTRLINLDTSLGYAFYFEPDGTVRTRLPKGRYLVHSTVFDGDPADEANQQSSHLLQPVLDLRRPHQVTLDARTARPVSVRLPRASARQIHAEVYYGVRVPDGRFVFGALLPDFGGLFLGAVGGDMRLDGLTIKLGGQWGEGRPDGTVDDSPYAYNLAWAHRGGALNGFHRDVRDRDLATVRARHLTHIPGGIGGKLAASQVAEEIQFGASVRAKFRTPFTRTEYYSGADGLRWTTTFHERDPGDAEAPLAAYGSAALGQTYRAGRRYEETWNRAVFGPSLPGGYDPARGGWAIRRDDVIAASVPMFGDRDGRAGASAAAGRVRLHRDGVLVDDVPLSERPAEFAVPPQPGRYRLEVVAERGAPFTLSTKVTGTWEFRSGRADRPVVPLALSAIRFTPRLDDRHTAPAGGEFAVPVSVQAQAGLPAAWTRSLSVEVSYDDGRTWKSAKLRRGPGGMAAVLTHPRGPGFVSLRATATDSAGNTAEETIIRAYRIA